MFQKVDDARFLHGEHDVLRFWAEHDIFRQLQKKNAGKKKWSFLDGPITANNPMGVHHAWGRTYKDVYQRFYAMTGHELRYQNGFDCQGLWVEVEVEKQLKLGSKTAIEEFGIDTFTRECKRRVLKFAARQTEQSIRLGYWMQWDLPEELRKLSDSIPTAEESQPAQIAYTTANGKQVSGSAEEITSKLGNSEWGGSYFTFSTENNETIWAFLKKCFERGKIYRGHDVMPWSGRGGSAYSQMEVADGRKLTTHRACFVRFPLTEKADGTPVEKEFLLVWTTTPWTLTSNVAAAVNPDLDYLRIKANKDGAIYYFAKDNLNFKRLEKEFKEGFGRPEWNWPEGVGKLKTIAQIFKEQGGFEELGTVKGSEMIGWRYSGPFDDLQAQKQRQPLPSHLRDLDPVFDLLSYKENNALDMGHYGVHGVSHRVAEIFEQARLAGAKAEKSDAEWHSIDSRIEELKKIAELTDEQASELERLQEEIRSSELQAIDDQATFIETIYGNLFGWSNLLIVEIFNKLRVYKQLGVIKQEIPTHEASLTSLRQTLIECGINITSRKSWKRFLLGVEVAKTGGMFDIERSGSACEAASEYFPSCNAKTTLGDLVAHSDIAHSQFVEEFQEAGEELLSDILRLVHDIPFRSAAESHRVIDGGRDFKGNANVVAGEGTGIVHIAPGCGDIDHKMGVELGLPIIAPLGEDGRYLDGFGAFTGLEATDPTTVDLVFEELKKKDLVVSIETYPHIYPFCWRTGDELVFRLVDEWFINMDWRDEIKDVTKCINWVPDSIQGQERELEWLTTMRDWMISKKRFWGLALPIWVNPNDPSDFEVIGSLAELKERALDGGEGWEQFEGHTPHRPWIDVIKIRSKKTGALLERIEDVGNPWLDAGIVPFSTLMYNSDKEAWKQWYPADLVTECFPGQFRNWFYSMLSLATMMRYDETEDPNEKRPFKNLLGHRLVMNEEGKPMHKSDGTAIWFEEAAEQLGVDTLRWLYLAQNPASDLRFGTRHANEPVTLETVDGPISETKEGLATCKVTSKPADDVRRQALIPLWNSYAFFVNYAILDGFTPTLAQVPLQSRPEIDRWILSRLQELTQTAHDAFSNLKVAEFMSQATEFIDDLSNWYIRRNRRRFWKGKGEEASAATQATAAPVVTEAATPTPIATAEAIYRTYLSARKQGLNRDKTTLLREVFAEAGSFTVNDLLVRLSRYKDGQRLHRLDIQRGLQQLVEAGLITCNGDVYQPAQAGAAPIASAAAAKDESWDADKLAAYQTLYEVLLTLSKLLAPCIPFLTERMYGNLVSAEGSAPQSVHLCDYPAVDQSKLDLDLNWKTQQVQTLVRMAHRLRESAELRVRQPLTELRFATRNERQATALQQYADIIADELNVKLVTRADNLDDLVTYAFKPNLKTLGPKYGKLLNVIRTGLSTVDPSLMAPIRSGESVTLTLEGNEIVLAPEDVMVSVQQASDWASADDSGIQIALSTKLTPELIQEGMARDLIRHIQQQRKDANLEENQRINVQWSSTGNSEIAESAIAAWKQTIQTETRADTIEFVSTVPDNSKTVSIGDVSIALAIK